MSIAVPIEIRNSRIRNILRGIPFFACLSEEEMMNLGTIIIEKHFVKNEVILLEENTQSYMYIVFSGRVKVVQVSYEGKEQILVIHKKGDFFGEMAMLDGKTAPATVIAMEETTIGLITRDDFERYFLRNEKILREMMYMLTSRLREAWMRLKVLSFADAEHRVRAVFNLLSIQYGVKDQRGTIISVRLTHKDIAAYASVSRETVTRLIDRFSHEQDIEFLDKKHILLRPSFFDKILLL
jgi:CRP/FNR family cyclic AMP-dependent transcriptional regulator